MRSMTAFGRLVKKIQGKTYTLEITSYNRKGLEVSLSVPKELSFLEMALRKKITNASSRGQILMRLTTEKEGETQFNPVRYREVHKNLSRLAADLDPHYKVSFETVIAMAKDLHSSTDDTAELQNEMEQALDHLLPLWIEMKEREASLLIKQMQESLAIMQKNLEEISFFTPQVREKAQAKLLEKLAQVKTVTDEDREKILREVVFYVEKMDISEEKTRLAAHIHELFLLFTKKDKDASGRMIDFIAQEMMREVNTLSAKTGEIEVIKRALLIKQEIEKIREQGQNIE